MKRLRSLAEAGVLWLALALFRVLPFTQASALGGWIARRVGPRLASKQRIARANLAAAFPEKSEREIAAIIDGMWDNLGRFMGEMPHLHELDIYGGGRVEIDMAPETEALADAGRSVIFITAHFGNWEIPPMLAVQRGLDLTLVYRRASNPWSERLIQHWREKRGGRWVQKGREGARALVTSLAGGGSLAVLADQKLNEGVAVPFFGRDAMTAPAIGEMSLRYGAPIVPVFLVRRPKARFHVTVLPPLEIERTGNRKADVYAILHEVNRLFEDWIRKHPDHWLWIHKRWPG